MRKIREVLRLKYAQGLSARQIALSVSMSRSSVQECLQRALVAKLSWPLPDNMDDDAMERLLYPRASVSIAAKGLPDFSHVQRELTRPGVTRRLLWEEHKAAQPNSLKYSAFCDHYRDWLAQHAQAVMRFEHRAGDKCFVDYAGQTIDIIDRSTGELRPAQIFVAALGCSNYTFAEATLSQTLPDWLGSHVRAFEFFGGVPAAVVPDNLKSGVIKAHRYDPQKNPAYADLAEHYGVTILPARAYKPRDKAKVENAVLIVERWILAKLRDVQFFSLAELNAAISQLLSEYNQKPFQKMDGSRHSNFIELDKPALKPLPAKAYEYANWKIAKVHLDYHIEVEQCFYSVPHRYIGAKVDVCMRERMIEILYKHQLIATHIRLRRRGQRATNAAHRPEKHRAHIDQNIERLIARAQHIDECVAAVLTEQFNKKVHPEEALRTAQGTLRMAQDFSPQQLINACKQALLFKTTSYSAIRHFITAQHTATKKETANNSAVRPSSGTPQHRSTESDEPRQLSLMHDNVRGPTYFNHQRELPCSSNP